MSRDRPHRHATFHIPQTNGEVRAPTRQSRTIRTECGTIAPTRMPCERAYRHATFHIPQTDGIIITETRQHCAIRT